MSRATGRHTRPKKLNAKQNVQIFREEQVEVVDYDSSRGIIETGVEKNEESEYHLQQAIKASEAAKADAKIKDAYIPTPPTVASHVQYDVLYPKGYRHPATYIRSSSTVEDCAGVPYSMDEEDELALKLINGRLPDGQDPCSEDQFEEVVNFFEETSQTKQPFAAVDNPPVLPLEELEEQIDETVPAFVKVYSKFVYEHWKSRKTATGNRPLHPQLKFETGQDTDDADPYVCFRRRELRQIRKTRNRDAQSAEKLRKMRVELEAARHILQLVKTRETNRKQQLEIDRLLFEQRHEAKKMKRGLNIKGDDEDFVNQKTSKRPHLSPGQQALAQQLRYPMVRGGPSEDLRLLEDHQAQRQEMIEKDIQNNVEKHIRWNEGYVDKTRAPLTPVSERKFSDRSADFRQAMPATEYLPTPPASESDDEAQNCGDILESESKEDSRPTTPFRYASPMDEELGAAMPSFRRRLGRGGRMIFDRRMPFRTKETASARPDDRFKFDVDDDDEVEEIVPALDQEIFHMMQHRAYLFGRAQTLEAAQAQAVRQAQIEAASNASQAVPPAATQQSTAVG